MWLETHKEAHMQHTGSRAVDCGPILSMQDLLQTQWGTHKTRKIAEFTALCILHSFQAPYNSLASEPSTGFPLKRLSRVINSFRFVLLGKGAHRMCLLGLGGKRECCEMLQVAYALHFCRSEGFHAPSGNFQLLQCTMTLPTSETFNIVDWD